MAPAIARRIARIAIGYATAPPAAPTAIAGRITRVAIRDAGAPTATAATHWIIWIAICLERLRFLNRCNCCDDGHGADHGTADHAP